MTDYSLKPIRVDLHASRMLSVLLGAACLIACAVLAVLPLPLWAVLPAILASLLATAHTLALHAWLRRPGSVVQVEVTAKGELHCMTRAGERSAAMVLGSSYVAPWLTVLHLRLPGRRLARHVVLLPDMLDADEFRRLRVWLRWGAVNAGETAVSADG